MIDFIKTLKNKAFYAVFGSYNAYYATNFCFTLWNVRYLEKNEQSTNKIDPHPRKTARAPADDSKGKQHFHSHREKFVYGL